MCTYLQPKEHVTHRTPQGITDAALFIAEIVPHHRASAHRLSV